MSWNFVYSKNYWDEAARTNPFARILSKYSQEKFWAAQPKIPGLNKGMIFLDLGCGIGRIARTVASQVKEYKGVDISEEMIKKAKNYYTSYDNVQFFVNNGSDLSIFEANQFDFVYSCLVFIHIQKEHIIGYVDEIYRTLKSGGVFYTVNFPKQESYSNGFSFEEVQRVFSIFEEIDIKDTRVCYYTIRCRK